MSRLAEIEAGISGMSELQDIVSAMRSLAGMRLREAQRAVPGIRRYAAVIAQGNADALCMMPRSDTRSPGEEVGPAAIVLCASEHGFVGGFNDRVAAAALEALGVQDRLFVLGARGAARATELGRAPDWTGPMATRPIAVTASIQHLVAALFEGMARGETTRITAVLSVAGQGTATAVERRRILPMPPAAGTAGRRRQVPLCNLDPATLLELLAEEYVFARLTEAAVESIAAENAARLAATEAAFENLSTMLGTLRRQATQARQSEITTEILELAAGAEVAAGP